MTTFALRGRAPLRHTTALACDTYGWGTPLLLIHGIGVSGAIFAPVISALAAHYHVIVPDLRGHGRSSTLGSPTSVAQLAADLPGLFDLLGVRRCHVLGYDHGGLVAQQLAASAPQRIHRMVLAATPAYPDQTARRRFAGTLRVPMAKTLGALLSGTSRGAADRYAANAARLLLDFDSRPLHSAIACPTLVLQGEQDRALPTHHGTLLADSLPNATLRTIPDAGHRMLTTHPDALIDHVLDWLT